MDHIEIYVRDLTITRTLYEWLLPQLGYELFQEWEEGFSFVKDGIYLVFVQTREKYLDTPYNRCQVGLNHIAFNTTSKEVLESIREGLIERDVHLLYEDRYPYAGGENHFALYFEDPDRIKLEIVLV